MRAVEISVQAFVDENGALSLPFKSITGNLSLCRLRFKYLPENLAVEGNLDLACTGLKELPRGLRVGGNLYVEKIASLPEDLVVGRNLHMVAVGMREIPPSVKVGGVVIGLAEDED